jgi:hypothetical protein
MFLGLIDLKMTKKHIAFFICGISFIVGWNIALIQRDKQLFDRHTPKEHYCAQQAQWHPDCNVE